MTKRTYSISQLIAIRRATAGRKAGTAAPAKNTPKGERPVRDYALHGVTKVLELGDASKGTAFTVLRGTVQGWKSENNEVRLDGHGHGFAEGMNVNVTGSPVARKSRQTRQDGKPFTDLYIRASAVTQLAA